MTSLVQSPTPTECGACHARHIGLCDALSNENLESLARVAQRIFVPAGKAFIEEDSKASHFYNLSRGNVSIFKSLADGRRQITGFIGAGHFLGHADSGNYRFSAEAITDVRLCRFDRAALANEFIKFPDLKSRLLEIVTHEMLSAQEQMLLLGRKTALERVASFLSSWAKQSGACQTQNSDQTILLIELPMSRGDIADYLGLTTETVSRSLSQLKRNGLIDFHNARNVTLLDAFRASNSPHIDLAQQLARA